ncbi:autotransporter domain-containing protein [Bordetella sp. LUAb4]|uniref:autotransporter outer membrane beta-barrel domain-containing protein n=1 Tax=Bordetella sp. LUAb4 TaxID=2843195 RepID=UPI001E553A4E|nr:autotransporter domain-containing protein [Bordetella sp. LUAb4]
MSNYSRYLVQGVAHRTKKMERATPQFRQRRVRLALAWGVALGLSGVDGVNEAQADEYAFTRSKPRHASSFATPSAQISVDDAARRTRRSIHEIMPGDTRFNCRELGGYKCMSQPDAAAKDVPTEQMDIQNAGWLFFGGPGDNNYASRFNHYRKVGKLTSQGDDNSVVFTSYPNNYELEGPVRLIGTDVTFQVYEPPYRVNVNKDATLKKLKFKFLLSGEARDKAVDGQELATIFVQGKADDSGWLDYSEVNDYSAELSELFAVRTEKVPGPDGTRYVFTLRKKEGVDPGGERIGVGGDGKGGGVTKIDGTSGDENGGVVKGNADKGGVDRGAVDKGVADKGAADKGGVDKGDPPRRSPGDGVAKGGSEPSGHGTRYDVRHVEPERVGPPTDLTLDASRILAPIAASPFVSPFSTTQSEGTAEPPSVEVLPTAPSAAPSPEPSPSPTPPPVVPPATPSPTPSPVVPPPVLSPTLPSVEPSPTQPSVTPLPVAPSVAPSPIRHVTVAVTPGVESPATPVVDPGGNAEARTHVSIIEKEPPTLVWQEVDKDGGGTQKLPALESTVVVESPTEGDDTNTVTGDKGKVGKTDTTMANEGATGKADIAVGDGGNAGQTDIAVRDEGKAGQTEIAVEDEGKAGQTDIAAVDAVEDGQADSKDAQQAEVAKEDESTVILEVTLAPIEEEAPAEEIAPVVQLADFVTTPNQKSVALAVESLPFSHPVSQAAYTLLVTNPNELAAFSSAISGEVHPTVDGSMRTAVEPVRDVSLSQLRAGLFGGRQPGALTADAGVSDAPTPPGVLPSSTIYPAWAQVTGNWQNFGGRDHSAKGRQRSGGIFIGMDEEIGGGWRAGGALGYTDSRLNVASLGSSANISSYSAILYGGKVLPAGPGAIHMMLGGAYTWHDVRTKRRVTGGGLDQHLRADYGANTTQLFAELGYALPVTPELTVQPYVGLSQANNRRRSFNERGGSAALSSKRQRSDTTTVTVGVRGTQDINLGRHKGQVSGALGWRRNSGDLRTKASMSFDAGDSFTVTGAPVTRDSLLVETGFKVNVGKSTAVGVNYAGQFGGGTRDHSASLNVSWRF